MVGIADFSTTTNRNLWDPYALAHGMNVILSLLIFRAGADLSLPWARLLFGKSK